MPTTEKPIELKFAHHNPPNAWTTVKWIIPWGKKVEEATKGRVKVTMYHARTLAQETQNFEAVQYGVSDTGWIVIGLYRGRFPLAEVLTLPFLNLPVGKVDGKSVAGGINGRMLHELYEKFPAMQAEWSAVKVLYMTTADPNHIATVKKPVRNQNDIKGLKIRVLGGGSGELLKSLGVATVSMQIPDIYESAQRGVIDGMNASVAQLTTYRLYEVFRYFTPLNLSVDTFSVIMNLDRWKSLSPDLQQAIMSVSGVYGAQFAGETAYGTELVQAFEDDMKKAGKVMETVNLDPGELDKWEKAGKQVTDKWIAEMEAKGLPAKQIVEEIYRLKEKYKP